MLATGTPEPEAVLGDGTSRLVRHAIRHARAGDREVVWLLWARYADDVLAHVSGIVQDTEEAETITLQVFARLLPGIATYVERDLPFADWLLRFARDVALTHVRLHPSLAV